MTYRSDLGPLRARLEAVDEELAALGKQLLEHEALRARRDELSGEQAALQKELAQRAPGRPLPLLDSARVASPCGESWDAMTGDARRRRCGSCKQDVYNLSEMTRDEVEALLRGAGEALCVRFYRRADGTIITADCPVGLRRRRRRLAAFTALAVGVLGATTFFVLESGDREPHIPAGTPVVMGSVASPDPEPPPGAVSVAPSPGPPASSVLVTPTPSPRRGGLRTR